MTWPKLKSPQIQIQISARIIFPRKARKRNSHAVRAALQEHVEPAGSRRHKLQQRIHLVRLPGDGRHDGRGRVGGALEVLNETDGAEPRERGGLMPDSGAAPLIDEAESDQHFDRHLQAF